VDNTVSIAIAVVETATGLASVLLVFVGFLVSTARSPGADKRIVRRYENLAKVGMVNVAVCMVVMLAGFSWLFRPETVWLLKVWTIGFPLAGWSFLVYAAIAVFMR
jgi:hypothetical protein